MTKKNKFALRYRQLTTAEESQKNAIVHSCANAWDHLHLPSTGSASLKNMRLLVNEAAEDAVLIKTNLERTSENGTPIRLVHGGAAEYLRNLETFPKDPGTFIRELVQAVFRNAKGNVCDTSPQDIDSRLDILLARKAAQGLQGFEGISATEKGLKDAWEQANQQAREIFAIIEENSFHTPEYRSLLSKALNNVQGMKQQLAKFHQVLIKAQQEIGMDDGGSDGMEEGDITTEVPSPGPAQPPRPATPGLEMEVDRGKGQEDQQAQQPEGDDEPQLPVLSPEEKEWFERTIQRVAPEVASINQKVAALEQQLEKDSPGVLGGSVADGRKAIRQLHSTISFCGESLNKHLAALDELVVGEEDRPRRKELVLAIQSTARRVDTLSPKIQQLSELQRSKEEEEERERTRVQSEQDQRKQLQEAGSRAATSMEVEEVHTEKAKKPVQEEEKPLLRLFEENLTKRIERENEQQQHLKEFRQELAKQASRLEPIWRKLQLKPNMVVDEASDAYLISAYIPGMNKQDVEILASREEYTPILSLRGHRSPTLDELALMRRQLVRAGVEPEDSAMIRLGTGRYGSFHEKYAIPRDIDANEITGRYEEGELVVVLPKLRLLDIPKYQNHRGGWW